jgi:hypothetical protein
MDRGHGAAPGTVEPGATIPPVISARYRPSINFFLLRMASLGGLLALCVFETINGAIHGHDATVVLSFLVGVGLVTIVRSDMRTRRRLVTILTPTELYLRDARKEFHVPISDIAGVCLVKRPLRSPIITWHVWQPGCWTTDGLLRLAPGIMHVGSGRRTERVLRSPAGRVAEDLYRRLREEQGEEGPVRSHRLQPFPLSAESVIELLDYPDSAQEWFFRWESGRA